MKLLSFWEVVRLGKQGVNNNTGDVEATPPTPDSPCIIMYTSGKPANRVISPIISD